MINKVSGQAIVFTDLDGTLLDHDDYSWDPAKEILQQLEANNIPVIFNTSKTRAELEYWRHETNNRHPFIVENGSALFIPENYSLSNPAALNKFSEASYNTIQLGVNRENILSWLENDCSDYAGEFIHFAQCNTEKLVELTELPYNQAELALQREYSEAIQWVGSEGRKTLFVQHVLACGYKILAGGRFLHILGDTNKGRACKLLCEHLQSPSHLHPAYSNSENLFLTTIACGDSNNDIDMLNWADLAILIRSKYGEFPKISNNNCRLSTAYGPLGWAEEISKVLFNANLDHN